MQASKNGLRYPRGASNIAAGFPGPCFMTSQSTPTLVSLRGRRKKFLDPKPDFSIAGGVNFSAHRTRLSLSASSDRFYGLVPYELGLPRATIFVTIVYYKRGCRLYLHYRSYVSEF